ncbi:MAG: di-heme-cytochrome C peroxidase [Vicinamibacterales bacterium]
MTESMEFEKKLPTEDADIAQIVAGVLSIQAKYAAQQDRPLARGTHAKGVCVRATFQVFDVAASVSDPALGLRLARGLFAKPGAYPATVRFANAASTFHPDSAADVRAMSFSIEVPAGVFGPAPKRLDFSMNDATTFPLNDAHVFANFMRIETRPSLLDKLKALFSLRFTERRGIYATAILAKKQQRVATTPYQDSRYWSTVPFLHGADQAIKYSATPRTAAPPPQLVESANVLGDHLVAHVNGGGEMRAFDFGLQFLDAERLTHAGRTHEPSYWIENASIEWNEAEAPFHTVGRLTLEAASVLPDAACNALHIDVTENALPENRPIGSINRARSAAEKASRDARRGLAPAGVTAAEARRSRSAFRRGWSIAAGLVGRAVLSVLVLLAGAILLLSAWTAYYIETGRGALPVEKNVAVVYPDQGWGAGADAAGRQAYYYTPQGASIKDLRYRWFINLELPLSKTRLASPEVMRRYGLLVDEKSAANPDQLPVGFGKTFDQGLNEDLVDITCAACHTGQINVTRGDRTTALRIDGGSALHAFTNTSVGHFGPTLLSSMLATAANPMKFSRFANNVLGEGRGGRLQLHSELRDVIGKLLSTAYTEKHLGLSPTEEGYGRTDALARIANVVFGENLDPKNYRIGNAPVNYPPVFNIWKFDWVQYNASVSQPMARNIGESMGTGAKYALVSRYGNPLPASERFRSSANIDNLYRIEMNLRKLQPPAWQEDVLGPIDRTRAARGKVLFTQHCQSCHGPHLAPASIKALNAPLKTGSEPEWLLKWLCIDDIGTDPNSAGNFASTNADMDITRTGLTADDLRNVLRPTLEESKQRRTADLNAQIAEFTAQPPTQELETRVAALRKTLAGLDGAMQAKLNDLNPASIKVGAALSYLGMMIRNQDYAAHRYSAGEAAERDGFGVLDLPQVVAAYKPRPLGGIWASPPFLHNGSVPTIYDLLSPVGDRPKKFRVGSREFDTVKLGLAQVGAPYWELDTAKDGNRNTGHEFSARYKEWQEGDPPAQGSIGPLLSHEDRLAIIEHLKVRNDDVDGDPAPHVPGYPYEDCRKPAPGPKPRTLWQRLTGSAQ